MEDKKSIRQKNQGEITNLYLQNANRLMYQSNLLHTGMKGRWRKEIFGEASEFFMPQTKEKQLKKQQPQLQSNDIIERIFQNRVNKINTKYNNERNEIQGKIDNYTIRQEVDADRYTGSHFNSEVDGRIADSYVIRCHQGELQSLDNKRNNVLSQYSKKYNEYFQNKFQEKKQEKQSQSNSIL